MDGDIDYTRYSRADLEEALTSIDRSRYPRNYENLRRELDARPAEPQREVRPPSVPFLIVCYAAAVLVLNALLSLILSAAAVVFSQDHSDFTDGATRLKEGIFLVLVTGGYFHLARNFRGHFAKAAVGVALVLSGLNLLAARHGPFRSMLSPTAAFVGFLAIALLAALIGWLLARCGFHACRPVIPADAGPVFHVMPGRV